MVDELKKRPRPEENRLPTCNSCTRYNRNLTENLSGGVSGVESTCSCDHSVMVWPSKPGCIKHNFIQEEFNNAALGSMDTSISVNRISDSDVSNLLSTLQDDITSLFGVKGALAIDWAGKNHSWKIAGILDAYQDLIIGRLISVITTFVGDSIRVHAEQQFKYMNLAMATMRHEIQEALNNARHVNMGDVVEDEIMIEDEIFAADWPEE